MKAISLWQPWATLMAIGAKTIETRSWELRGKFPLVICSTAKWDKEILELLTAANRHPDLYHDSWSKILNALRSAGIATLGELPLGAALCIVQPIGSRRTEDVRDQISEEERAFGDYRDERYGWMTDKGQLRMFKEPIPVKGKQGLWEFPDELLPVTER